MNKIPEGFGVCPKCNGTLVNDKGNDCRNCGGQYMFGTPKGYVPLNKLGKPCLHEYKGSKGNWNCTTNYDCIHCGNRYMIDSGG